MEAIVILLVIAAIAAPLVWWEHKHPRRGGTQPFQVSDSSSEGLRLQREQTSHIERMRWIAEQDQNSSKNKK